MKEKYFELQAIYDARASFYGKAKIKETRSYYILYSYNTEILKYNKNNDSILFLTDCPAHFSATTFRHINEFIKQFTNHITRPRGKWLQMAKEHKTNARGDKREQK